MKGLTFVWGMGNELKGDDAVGIRAAEMVKTRASAGITRETWTQCQAK